MFNRSNIFDFSFVIVYVSIREKKEKFLIDKKTTSIKKLNVHVYTIERYHARCV